jgi:flagellar biosynthesis/type III secretory pathway protein FliH
MIEQLKSKLKELEIKKQELQPKIDKIEEKKAEEIQELNKKYDHMIQDVNAEVEDSEQKIMNDIIDLFSKVVMDEFDSKRSTSEYMVTENFKEFREKVSEIELFPRDLIERLDKVIEGGLIENIAYDLEKIETEYKNH